MVDEKLENSTGVKQPGGLVGKPGHSKTCTCTHTHTKSPHTLTHQGMHADSLSVDKVISKYWKE